jgi:geranylgeranyl pyrophosphate synthase
MPTNPDDDGRFKRRRLTQAYEQFNRLSHAGNGQVPFFKILDSKVYSNDGKRVDLPMRWRFAIAMHTWLSENGAPKRKLPPEFFERQLPFILEVIISVQYYHNQILDRKGGVTTHAAINDNLIMGNLLKDQLYRYIDNLGLEDADRKKVIRSVRSIFEYVDIGQYIEKSCNTYEVYCSGQWSHPFGNLDALVDANCIREVTEVIQSVHPIKRTDYLHIYLQRIYLTNAVLFIKATGLIATLLDVDPDVQHQADRFAGLFGMMQQIMNDNCDMVPSTMASGTVEKHCTDAFSDLRNRNITLPILLHIQRRNKGMIADYLKNTALELNERIAFQQLCAGFSIYYSIDCGKCLRNKLIAYLSPQGGIGFARLEAMSRVGENNRYYRFFYDRKLDHSNYDREKDRLKLNRDNHDTGDSRTQARGGPL